MIRGVAIIGTWVAALLVGSTGLGAELSADRHTVFVELTNDSKSNKTCLEIKDAVLYHLKSLERFKFVEEKFDYRIVVSCIGDITNAIWYKEASIPIKISSAKAISKGTGPKALGMQLAVDLLDGLPFEGEVTSIVPVAKGRKSLLKKTKKKKVREGTLSQGRLGNKLIGHCLPIEVGTFTTSFKSIGRGLLIQAREFDSFAEFRFSSKNLKKGPQKLVFRFLAPLKVTKAEKTYVDKCKKQYGDISEGAMFATPFDDDLEIGSDLIELNAIRQRGGSYIFFYQASNGRTIPYGLLAYAHNDVSIGDYFELDARVYRHVYTQPYAPKLDGKSEDAPEITIGEGFMAGRFEILGHKAMLGLGLMLDKINVSYLNDGGRFVPRTQRTRGAFLAKYNYDWSETQWSGLRIGVSLSKGGSYTSINIDHNIMLTRTWFIGVDSYFLFMGDSEKGEPGGKLGGIGAHMGFAIERER